MRSWCCAWEAETKKNEKAMDARRNQQARLHTRNGSIRWLLALQSWPTSLKETLSPIAIAWALAWLAKLTQRGLLLLLMPHAFLPRPATCRPSSPHVLFPFVLLNFRARNLFYGLSTFQLPSPIAFIAVEKLGPALSLANSTSSASCRHKMQARLQSCPSFSRAHQSYRGSLKLTQHYASLLTSNFSSQAVDPER
jgi:hypothetical protein